MRLRTLATHAQLKSWNYNYSLIKILLAWVMELMLLSHEYDGISQFPLIFFVHLNKASQSAPFNLKWKQKLLLVWERLLWVIHFSNNQQVIKQQQWDFIQIHQTNSKS